MEKNSTTMKFFYDNKILLIILSISLNNSKRNKSSTNRRSNSKSLYSWIWKESTPTQEKLLTQWLRKIKVLWIFYDTDVNAIKSCFATVNSQKKDYNLHFVDLIRQTSQWKSREKSIQVVQNKSRHTHHHVPHPHEHVNFSVNKTSTS